ncbi:MAG: hypothetical protein V3V19_00230 [Cocleimonas sp.]
MSAEYDDSQEFLATPSGSLKMSIKGNDYLIRIMRPSGSASLHELQRSLQRNRDMLKESYDEMLAACRDEIIKKKKGADHLSPTQNALVARANIDLLIPLINVRGGVASYKGKLEAMPIEKHIEKLRNKAVKKVEEEISSTRLGSFFIIILVLIIATFFLYLFA